MPKTKISEFSATPASNTDIDSINIAEGCAPSGINDAIRELMAQLKDFQTGAVGDSFNGPVGSTTAATGAFTTLTTTGNTTVGNATAGTNRSLIVNGVVSKASRVTFQESGTDRWLIGNGAASENGNFEIYDATNGNNFVLTRSGNLGLGVTPSAWNSSYKVLQLNTQPAVWGSSDTLFLSVNQFQNTSGSNRYIANGFATQYRQDSGTHQFYTAASGTAGNAITFTQAMTLDASGKLGIGTTSPSEKLHLEGSGSQYMRVKTTTTNADMYFGITSSSVGYVGTGGSDPLAFYTAGTERARIDSSGNFYVAKTVLDSATTGCILLANGEAVFAGSSIEPLTVNRNTSDGTLVSLRQDNTQEGTISVSGTTVSYNGGHLSRWAQTSTAKDDSLVKGTVLSNLDAMNVYTDAEGNPVDNEQLNKVKVSDVEGDANVAGVFVNWTHDEQHDVDEINMAMTGDMIIRIAQGVTVQRGDLLMSAGNGTAKPQGDDIVRSKTIAKVTSNHVTCTYADGSYCVPCVLMAC